MSDLASEQTCRYQPDRRQPFPGMSAAGRGPGCWMLTSPTCDNSSNEMSAGGGDTTYICSSRLPSNEEALEIGMELMENQRARRKPVMDYPSPIRPTRLGTRASTKEHKAQESPCIGIQSGVRPFSDIFHCSSKASSSAALCWRVKCTIKKFSSYFLPTKQIPPLNRFLPVPLFALNYFCSWYFFSVGILQICIINFISLFF